MSILVACEESQAVTIALRERGYEAFSCDILPCSGNHPEWHLQQDVLPILNDGWDMIIAFPPCTHLARSGGRWFKEKQADGRQQQGISFFMSIVKAKCDRIAIENPVGIMSTVYRKPDQIIQPWMFGDPFEKQTCLWLNGVPHLLPTNIVTPPNRTKYGKGRSMAAWCNLPPSKDRAMLRSKTFQGIAEAMADQWGGIK
jgi:site-specific DNA-cytosine methylase